MGSGLHPHATNRQELEKGAAVKILKDKLSLNSTRPFKIIAVAPSSAADTPENRSLRDKGLYLYLPSNLSSSAAMPLVKVVR